jgi:hypothetical protein
VIKRLSPRQAFFSFALLLLAALLALYWPILHADFAWDELLDSLTSISARSVDPWRTLLIGQTNGFATYFRPLVMALFSLELRVFAFQPGPMHAVSLAIHAINVVLVGVLALRLSERCTNRRFWQAAVLPMLIYAVHPLLIEPVSWIGCQYDLAMTTFTLLGLLANVTLRKPWLRTGSVALCFFFAACSKESAASFPLVLLAFDWLLMADKAATGAFARLRALIRTNTATYAGVLLAGIIYLALRHHYLGHLLQATPGRPLGMFGRAQEVAYLLVHYLRMMLWPMTGLNPIHPVDVTSFRLLTAANLATDLIAVALVGAAVVLTLRRQALGVLLLVAMACLLPVLHILPVKFDASLYHERYAMTALALACCLLPLVIRQAAPLVQGRPLLRTAAYATLSLWILGSLANVRATVPLWSSDVLRWQWAYLEYPDSAQAQESLLGAYIDHQAYGAARGMVDKLLSKQSPCLICVVHAADEALATNQPVLAGMLLDRLDSSGLPRDREVAQNYLVLRKRIASNRGDSLALRASFNGSLNAYLSDATHERTGVRADMAIPVSADALLAFAREQQAGRQHPYPLRIRNPTSDDGSSAVEL